MREIKFRAFSQPENRMIAHAQIDYSFLSHPQNDWADDFVLMQFTGLKDRNGKEIYEGDIVTRLTGPRETRLGRIEYQRAEFVFALPSEVQAYKSLTDVGWKDLNVIGNIYENPGLLP